MSKPSNKATMFVAPGNGGAFPDGRPVTKRVRVRKNAYWLEQVESGRVVLA